MASAYKFESEKKCYVTSAAPGQIWTLMVSGNGGIGPAADGYGIAFFDYEGGVSVNEVEYSKNGEKFFAFQTSNRNYPTTFLRATTNSVMFNCQTIMNYKDDIDKNVQEIFTKDLITIDGKNYTRLASIHYPGLYAKKVPYHVLKADLYGLTLENFVENDLNFAFEFSYPST